MYMKTHHCGLTKIPDVPGYSRASRQAGEGAGAGWSLIALFFAWQMRREKPKRRRYATFFAASKGASGANSIQNVVPAPSSL